MRLFFPYLCIIFSIFSIGQTKPPRLWVESKQKDVCLSEVSIDIRIHGPIAETSMTMLFKNDTNQTLEGELFFPLPGKATLNGYALDVDGQMIESVAVEKHKARITFEKIVRKETDPGLVEYIQGNLFKTRVYPIPANGSRKIRIRYIESFNHRSQNQYRLPLHFEKTLDHFDLKLTLFDLTIQPKQPTGSLSFLSFKPWQKGFTLEGSFKDKALKNDLLIDLPQVDKPEVYSELSNDGYTYYIVQPNVKPPTHLAPSYPKHLTIVWDTSHSRNRDHHLEVHLLDSYLKNLLQHQENCIVRLFLFNNQVQDLGTFSLEIPIILSHIKGLAYDGATNYGILAKTLTHLETEQILLFSDGKHCFGQNSSFKNFKAPIFTIHTTGLVNVSFLRGISHHTGGQRLLLEKDNISQIVKALTHPVYRYFPDNTQDVYPSIPQPLTPQFLLVGRYSNTKPKLQYSFGLEKGSIKSNNRLDLKQPAKGSLLKKFWVHQQLQELLMDEESNQKKIKQLGETYNLTTPFTSLLVLDSVDQYFEYRIEPPQSKPVWRDLYRKKLLEFDKEVAENHAKDMNELAKLWKDRVDWWRVEFPDKPTSLNSSSEKDLNTEESWEIGLPDAPQHNPELSIAEANSPFENSYTINGTEVKQLVEQDGAVNETVVVFAENPIMDTTESSSSRSLTETEVAEFDEEFNSIELKPADPESPYIKIIKKSKQPYKTYIEQKDGYGNSPAFYLECSRFFHKLGETQKAITVLSNLAEIAHQEPGLLRVLAYRLQETGNLNLAISTFSQIKDLRPEEPQSYRDLALAYALRKQNKDIETALGLLKQVISKKWDRFFEIELIALDEYNYIYAKSGLKKFGLDPKFKHLLDEDIRIVLSWDADLTDIDLWVTEPTGQKAFYSQNRTAIGGRVSKDFTDGYGPEEYTLRRAIKGEYKIQADYFGSSATKLTGSITLRCDLYTNYGRPEEIKKSIILHLSNEKEQVEVGRLKF